MYFHETRHFFLLWIYFIFVSILNGTQQLSNHVDNIYEYIMLIVLSFIMYMKPSNIYNIIFPTSILITNTITLTYNNDYYLVNAYRYLALSLGWIYCAMSLKIEESKNHFPFYSIISICGIPTMKYVKEFTNINDKFQIIILWCAQAINIITCLIMNSQDFSFDWAENNPKNFWILIIIFLHSWICKKDNAINISNNKVITDINEIQYGIVGMTFFISVCASIILRQLQWKHIMYIYCIFFLLINTNIYQNQYTKLAAVLLEYLIFHPLIYMNLVHQEPFNIRKAITLNIATYAIAKIIPYYHLIFIFPVYLLLWFATTYKVSQISETQEKIRKYIECDCELI